MFICKISKLEVGGILRQRSRKCIGDKLLLFLPNLVKFNFLNSEKFSRNSVVLKLRSQAFCVLYVKGLQNKSKHCQKDAKNLVGWLPLKAFACKDEYYHLLLMQRFYCSEIHLLESVSQLFHNLLNLKDQCKL